MKNVAKEELITCFGKTLDDFRRLIKELCSGVDVHTDDSLVFFTSETDSNATSDELDSEVVTALSEYFDVNIVTFYAIDHPVFDAEILIEYV